MTINKLADFLDNIFDGPRRIQLIEHGAPYIRLGDLDAGEIYFDPHQTSAPLNLESRFYLRPGDVLVSKTGDEPRAVVTSSEAQGALIAPDIYCLRTIPELLSATWLAYFLNTTHGQRLLIERSSGVTVRRLHMADLRSLPLMLPPQELVREIEALEHQAQANSQSAHEIWAAIISSMYAEIDERSGFAGGSNAAIPEIFLTASAAQKVFRPLSEVARIAVSSRKTLKHDQLVSYVQASDIDPQSFLFRRLRSALAQDLPSRIRLPLQAYQVLLLASGSNLGTPAHPVAVVDAKLDGGFASNAFLALDFHETPIYFSIALKHPIVLEQIRRMAVGPVVSTLRRKDIIHLRIPLLSAVWRQDFNDRAQLAWERRTLALTLRRQAMDKAEAFIQQTLTGAAE
ncbi:hypothetical protein D4S03_07185 [bacterium]|nr:MAG: hypothetical protein D4S03_07185 [bacterium]